MISALAHGSRRKSAFTYTLRGMVISSALYPILTVTMLAIATFWTNRPTWSAPHTRHGR